MKVLIINYNRLTLPAVMADWVALHGCEPVFIDNNSDYAPLMEYYHSCGYMVMHMNKNYGHTVPWLPEANILGRLGLLKERYIVTDSDLDLASIPHDWLKLLNDGLDQYPQFVKCGFSLRLDDLPPSTEGAFIRECEARYWTKPLGDMFYQAPIDTTFALYRAGAHLYTHSALRTKPPYTAKHLPWYYTDLALLPEDEQYYFKTANDSSTGKKRLVK